jgi:hypothetical protein
MSSRDLLLAENAATRFLVRDQVGPFFASLAERPPALPLLAVRAARRAVAANPEDANAWLRLGQAYVLLRGYTCERSGEGMLPPLAQLRHIQIVTALGQALRLDPDLEAAHRELAYLYGERRFLDQALEHRREEIRLSQRAGPRPDETPEEFAYRMDLEERDLAKLEVIVEENRGKYLSAVRQLQGDRRAQAELALRLGLARQAVDEVLLSSPADLLGSAGLRLEVELLLSLGRAHEVRGVLGDKRLRPIKQGLGYYDLPGPNNRDGGALYPLPYRWPAYEWLHLLEAAAVGDYDQARVDLRATRADLRARHDRLRQQPRGLEAQAWALLPGVLSGPLPFLPAFSTLALGQTLAQKAALEAGEQALRAQQADLAVLEGLLALEQGDPDAARSAFAEAQELGAPPAGAAAPFAGRPIATGYLGYLTAVPSGGKVTR